MLDWFMLKQQNSKISRRTLRTIMNTATFETTQQPSNTPCPLGKCFLHMSTHSTTFLSCRPCRRVSKWLASILPNAFHAAQANCKEHNSLSRSSVVVGHSRPLYPMPAITNYTRRRSMYNSSYLSSEDMTVSSTGLNHAYDKSSTFCSLSRRTPSRGISW